MSKPLDLHSAVGGYYTIATNDQGHVIMAAGTTVPADATAGFAPGCQFNKLGSTDLDAAIYFNVGTSHTSCNFDPIQSA